ncbi:MAG: glycosyltransferase family 2 protein [Candidatus Omnitrophica bacterium]|nr:glycosyltransferase family 2 protein [Candidatus Omnitrophota bacterium]
MTPPTTLGTAPRVKPPPDRVGTPEVSIVVPIHNEQDSLAALVEQIRAALEPTPWPWEILGVDDGSSDGSAEAWTRLVMEDSRLRQVQLTRRFGQTAAIAAGIAAARGQYVVLLDADLQNDPADIPEMVTHLESGYDVVSGWRQDRQDSWLTRRLPSQMANALISRVSGVRLHDYGCTLKVYRRECLEGLQLFGEMHRLIPLYLAWQGARIMEMPVHHRPRLAGRSKYGLSRLPRVILDVGVAMFLIRYSDRPMRVFGGFGLVSIGAACVCAVWAIYWKLVQGVAFIVTPLPLLTVFFFLVGALALLMGLLAEIMVRTYYDASPRPYYRVKEVTGSVDRVT